MNRFFHLLLSLAAAALAAVSANSQTINFSVTDGVIESIDVTEVEFTAGADYNSSSIQFRIYDLFAEGTSSSGSVFDSTAATLWVNDSAYSLTQFGITSSSLSGGPEADSTFWITASNTISIATGDVVSLTASTVVTGHIGSPLALPISGAYTAEFVSQANGDLLAGPGLVNVTVPEPSTYALVLGLGGLAVALLRRRPLKS